MADKVTIEFTSEYQLNAGTWYVPGTKLVMRSNGADWFIRRGLAKVVGKTQRKRKQNDRVDTDTDSGSD